AHISNEVQRDDAELLAMKPALQTAVPFVANMKFASSFETGKPRYLACLRDIVTALPADGQINFTSFNLSSDLRGQVIGHAGSEQNLLALADKLAAAGRFASLNSKIMPTESKG